MSHRNFEADMLHGVNDCMYYSKAFLHFGSQISVDREAEVASASCPQKHGIIKSGISENWGVGGGA